ncbi:MAG: hypothetical protein ACOY90_08065 [Candidatus Zhuqueibacterota bacterium]
MKRETIWVIPYIDQPLSFWKNLAEHYDRYIHEVYFPILMENVPSGRPMQPTHQLQEFLEASPFRLSVLINPVVFPRPVEEMTPAIIETLKNLCNSYRIQSVTLSNVTLAKNIRESIPRLRLTASVLMDIFSPNQLAMINGIFDTLVASSRIVRNLPALTLLRESFSGGIRLIVNEGCLPNCVFRTQHFYEMGSKLPYPQSLCLDMLSQKPWLRLTGSWILPQHLHLYNGLFDTLKLAGRVTLQNPSYYREVLDAYIFRSRRSPHRIGAGPASPRTPIEIGEEFFKQTLMCHKACHRCTVCEDYYRANSR